jgi:hypothetical protein
MRIEIAAIAFMAAERSTLGEQRAERIPRLQVAIGRGLVTLACRNGLG